MPEQIEGRVSAAELEVAVSGVMRRLTAPDGRDYLSALERMNRHEDAWSTPSLAVFRAFGRGQAIVLPAFPPTVAVGGSVRAWLELNGVGVSGTIDILDAATIERPRAQALQQYVAVSEIKETVCLEGLGQDAVVDWVDIVRLLSAQLNGQSGLLATVGGHSNKFFVCACGGVYRVALRYASGGVSTASKWVMLISAVTPPADSPEQDLQFFVRKGSVLFTC